jgi:hypothetical protein
MFLLEMLPAHRVNRIVMIDSTDIELGRELELE